MLFEHAAQRVQFASMVCWGQLWPKGMQVGVPLLNHKHLRGVQLVLKLLGFVGVLFCQRLAPVAALGGLQSTRKCLKDLSGRASQVAKRLRGFVPL